MIEDNEDKTNPKRKVAIYRAPGWKRRRILCLDRAEAEAEIVLNADKAFTEGFPGMLVDTAVLWWLHQEEVRGVSDGAQYSSSHQLDLLIEHARDRPIGSLTDEDFTTVRAAVTQGSAATTSYFIATTLDRFMNDAQRRGFIHWNPAAAANHDLERPGRVEVTPFFPDEEETERTRRVADPMALAALDCMLEAGAKKVDLIRLRKEDVDFARRRIRFRGTTSIYDEEGLTLARWLRMTDRLASSLLRYRLLAPVEHLEYFFCTMSLKQLRQGNVHEAIERAQLKAGVTRLDGEQSGHRHVVLQRVENRVERRPHFAKYECRGFRHVAAIRWAKEVRLKALAYRLGISVYTAHQLYGSVYDEARSLAWVSANPTAY